MNANKPSVAAPTKPSTMETTMRTKLATILAGLSLCAAPFQALAHTQNNAPQADAAKARGEADARVRMVLQNRDSAKGNFDRAKKAVELGALETAVEEMVHVQKLARESDRLAAEARQLLHASHAHVATDPNGPAKAAFDAAAEVRSLALQATELQVRCCDVGFSNKAAYELMKGEFDKQLELLKKDSASAESEAGTLQKAASEWSDVDAAARTSLAKIVGEFAPALKGALALFEKLSRVALAAIDYTVDGSDEHFATLKKEGTTATKVMATLTTEGGGAVAKFSEDLDELGVPTMNKSFKVAKARLETVARVGERVLNAAILVLRPGVRAKVKEKSSGDYQKLLGAAKEKLVAVVAEIKKVQESLGSGGASGGESPGEAEKSADEGASVQAE